MNTGLEVLHPKDRQEVVRLARETGRTISDIVAELVHEALVGKARGGANALEDRSDPAYDASKTELGQKLRALSRKYVESGKPLLSADEICADEICADEICAEVLERRGEVD